MRSTVNSRNDSIHEQAAAGVARLAADDVSASDRADFQEWLSTSPEHQKSFNEAQQTWVRSTRWRGSRPLANVPSPRRSVRRSRAAAPSSTRRRLRRGRRVPAGSPSSPRPSFSARLWWAVSVLHEEPPQLAATAPELRTNVGERRREVLADGSVVWLNTDTEILVALSPARCSLRLVSGEAYFDVAKDPTRPFVVSAGDRTITAIGTAFNVTNRGSEVRVTVVEGTVVVARRPAAAKIGPAPRAIPSSRAAAVAEGPTRVTRAQEAVLAEAEVTVSDLAPEVVAHEGSWREGRLFFDAVTLKEMVGQLEPYLGAHVDPRTPVSRASSAEGSSTWTTRSRSSRRSSARGPWWSRGRLPTLSSSRAAADGLCRPGPRRSGPDGGWGTGGAVRLSG